MVKDLFSGVTPTPRVSPNATDDRHYNHEPSSLPLRASLAKSDSNSTEYYGNYVSAWHLTSNELQLLIIIMSNNNHHC